MTKVQMLSSEVQRSNTEMYTIKPVQSHGNFLLNHNVLNLSNKTKGRCILYILKHRIVLHKNYLN